MKKFMSALLVLLAFLMTMASCSAAKAVQKLDTVEDTLEMKLDAVEETLEMKLESAEENLENRLPETVPAVPAPSVPPVPAQTEPIPVETSPVLAETRPASPAVPENSGLLTGDQARQAALDHLGFTADQVERLRVEFEMDDRIPQFDVEFYQGDWEYELEIHAETGSILSSDKDHKWD